MQNKFLFGAALTLVSCFAFAGSNMHYGHAATKLALTTNATSAKAVFYPSLEITNVAYHNTYSVTTAQRDGTVAQMILDDYYHAPYNVISIDDPIWPVRVTIVSTYYHNVVFDGYVTAGTPFITCDDDSCWASYSATAH